MSRARKTVAAMGALSLALGFGLAVQTALAAGQDEVAAQSGALSATAAPVQPQLAVPDITLTSAPESPSAAGVEPAAAFMTDMHPTSLNASLRTAPAKPSLSDAPCMIRSRATPQAAALVRLHVSATCLPNSRVTVHHGGMLFAETTDDHGHLDIMVPALAEHAVFMLTFAGEQMAMALAHVPDLADYNRIVLQWQGHAGFELHALDSGAASGSEGHVRHGAVEGDAGMRAGPAGSRIRLGNTDVPAPMVADVYSHLSGTTDAGNRIALRVEAEVTERNCGRDFKARRIELTDDTRLDVRSVTLSVPDCDTVGDHLVLNNVFEDLKVAAR